MYASVAVPGAGVAPDQRGLHVQTGRAAAQLAAFQGSERCLRKVLHAGADANSVDQVLSSPSGFLAAPLSRSAFTMTPLAGACICRPGSY